MINTYTFRARKRAKEALDSIDNSCDDVEMYVLGRLRVHHGSIVVGLSKAPFNDNDIRQAIERLMDKHYIDLIVQTYHPEPKDLQEFGKVIKQTFSKALTKR